MLTPKVPKTVVDRLKKHTRSYQKILKEARDKDKNEADTSTIVTGMLEDVFGFNRLSDEIAKEVKISDTRCDLAVKIRNEIKYLIEVKPIGAPITKKAIRQAVNYCIRQGVKWVVLTNGIDWMVYRVVVVKKGKVTKVTEEQVCKFNFLDVNLRRQADQDMLFMLCKKGVDKDLLDQHYARQRLLDEFTIAATLMSEEIRKAIKSLLRKISPNSKIDEDEIKVVIEKMIKRNNWSENDMFEDAEKKINSARKNANKKRVVKKTVTKPDEGSGGTINTLN